MAGNYDDEIVVALTAQTAQLEEGMAQANASIQGVADNVAREAAAFNAATQAKIDAMMRLNTAFAGSVSSAGGLAEAESALDQAMAAGALSAQEYAGYMARLDAAEASLVTAAEAATAAVAEQNAAFTLSGGVAREVGVMIGEIARGNYTRLEGSTITLANRTGFLSTALNALLSPLGMAAIAAAAAGYAIFEAGQQFEHMEGTVLATGGAAGYTAGQLVGMADRIGESTGSISNAMEAIQKLAESGRFAGQDLQLVGQAAASMAALTGESVQSCVAQIIRLQEDPVKAVAKLNDQYHFLTVAQFQQIEAAQQAGDSQKAASLAYEAMADKMQGRTDELNQHVNILVRSWRDLKQVWAESMQEVDHALGGGDDAYGLNEAKQLLVVLKQQEEQAKETGSSALPGIRLEIQRQQQVVDQLTAKFESTAAAAAKVGQAAQQSAAKINGMAKDFKGNGSVTRDLESELRKQEADQQVSYDKREAFESDYWQKVLSSSQAGSAEYIAAWQHVQSSQQQLDRQQEESWKRAQSEHAAAAKEATRQVIESFELERSEAQQASAQRIAIDAAMMARIEQMEGQQSADFKRALNERLADTKAFVDAAIAEQKREQAELEGIYKAQNEAAIKAINETYAAREKQVQDQLNLHQISNSTEIELLRQYAQQEYDTEMSVLEHYRELMADKPRVVETINAQIEQLQQSHANRMRQIDDQSLKQQEQAWTQGLRPITQAFDQSIMGMIQGTQTLQQGVARALQSIMLSYIRTIIDSGQQWLAGELAKTTATQAGVASRVAAQAAGAKQGLATEAASQQQEIMNAASTAAAKAYQAVVGIPFVGPVLAPVAAAGAFAAVEAYDTIASASGGWDRVPFDDAPALLHRNEMVLPAHLADNVRNMTGNGGKGGGDTHNWNLSMMDGRSAHQLLMQDSGGMRRLAQRAMQVTRKR